MDLIGAPPWTVPASCGAAFLSHPTRHRAERPVHQRSGEPSGPALRPLANQPCPVCGGPVCADCGKALVTRRPHPARRTDQARRGGDRR